ncbi:Sodium/calcium exchanger protein-domain-containing protein [Phlyctochytrium arcticum]|nr:Sodium/calcium exchanger protein-domain-containing protein [Phlyctochytrium arcticum]
MPAAYGAIPTSSSPRPRDPIGRSDSDAGFILGPAPPTTKSSLRYIFFSNYINVLIVFVPLGIIAGLLNWSDTVIFMFNFIALIPMAKLLGLATEELALRTNQTIGGLLNATFGNAVELIVGLIALHNGLLTVVQASLLGSILSNLLLVLGASFLAGGIYHKNQRFNVTAAQTAASLLCIAVLAFVVPAAFRLAVNTEGSDKLLLELSRGTAVVLFVIYLLYLYFQLKTHQEFFVDETGADEGEEPSVTLPAAVVLLLSVTVLVSVCGEFLVGSIETVAEQWNLSQTFVGLILLPIVGNAAEHVTAVSVAMKDKMDLVIGVAIGSSMQIALCVTPICVIFGWIWGQPLTLAFSAFETTVMFVSVFVTNSVIQDGQTNYLEGVMLLGAYFVIAGAFYVMPNSI